MQKIKYIIIAVMMALVSSCSMELTPEGTISNKDAFESIDDYRKFWLGLNQVMRYITSGDYVILSDIQLDDFNAVIGNGNRRMAFYNGQIYPSTNEIAAIYSGYYSAIAQINYFLESGANKLEDSSLTETDRERLSKYVASAYFFRAYCYSCMADKFCQSYKNCSDRDKEGTGLSLQLVYRPTADHSKYPGRSSLTATYKQILDDLDKASKLMVDAKVEHTTKENIGFPSNDAVLALKARVYLNMGMDKNAAEIAEAIIKSNLYPLEKDKKKFHTMWFNDEGSEIIWMITGDYNHHGSPTGDAFCKNEYNPDYVPTNDAIYMFSDNDTRWYAWFENEVMENVATKIKKIEIANNGASADMYLFGKYPGNPIFTDKGALLSNFINQAKPLRIGEMYLIAAEANANLGEETKAEGYLYNLMDARQSIDLSAADLIQEIYNERHRELMGEGMRQADLKRWNIGFSRSDAFDGHNEVIIFNFRNQSYEAGDYRLTWPIPLHEMETNPQLAGQQNPGY